MAVDVGGVPMVMSGGDSGGVLGGGFGAGLLGGLFGGLLFGDGFRGNRDNGGSRSDIDSRVDTLALLQANHANALQTANQTNDITNRTFEQTIALLNDNDITQREVLTNRFETQRGFCETNHNIDNKSWENRLAISELRGNMDRQFADTNCLIRTTETNAIMREQARQIEFLKGHIDEMKTRELVERVGRNINCNISNFVARQSIAEPAFAAAVPPNTCCC